MNNKQITVTGDGDIRIHTIRVSHDPAPVGRSVAFPNPKAKGKRKRSRPVRPDHLADGSECHFGKGNLHTCYVIDVNGQRYKDVTRVQRCSCGERKVTRVSRTPFEIMPD